MKLKNVAHNYLPYFKICERVVVYMGLPDCTLQYEGPKLFVTLQRCVKGSIIDVCKCPGHTSV